MRIALPSCLALALLGHAALAWLCLQGGTPAHAAPAPRTTLVLLAEPPPATPQAPHADAAPPAERMAAAGTPADPAPVPPPAEAAGPAAGEAAAPVSADNEKPRDLAVALDKDFVPSTELELAPLPKSAPDISMLQGLAWSGLPMRLRLYVDAQGTVVDVQVLQTSDEETVTQRVRSMFLATAFIPGRVHGRDVPSYKDIELNVGRAG
jgi:hypothetical protein